MFILLSISPLGVVALHTNTLPPINIHTLQIFVVVDVVCFVDVVDVVDIYIMMKCVFVCHQKSLLPTSKLSAG